MRLFRRKKTTVDDKVADVESRDEPADVELRDEGRDVELREERKAADGKARKLNVEVTQLPKVNRGKDGAVTSATIVGKAAFKGEVTLRLRGDIASAYWSLTPGMKLAARVFETGDKVYDVDALDVVPAG